MFEGVTNNSTLVLKDVYGLHRLVSVSKVEGNVIYCFGERFNRETGVELSHPSWRNPHILYPLTQENTQKVSLTDKAVEAYALHHKGLSFAKWAFEELNEFVNLVHKVNNRLEKESK